MATKKKILEIIGQFINLVPGQSGIKADGNRAWIHKDETGTEHESLVKSGSPTIGQGLAFDPVSGNYTPLDLSDGGDGTTSLLGYRVPMCGDSNMIGFSGAGYSPSIYYGELTGFTCKNLAVGGKKSDEIRDEQIPTALQLAHKYVIVMTGTNDTPAGYTVDETSGYIEDICMSIINAGRIPIIVHILPGDSGIYKTERDAINARTSNFASVQNALLVTTAWADDGSGGLRADIDNGDTVHLNIAGQQELASNIYTQTGIELSTETNLQKGSYFGTAAPENNNIDDDIQTWDTPENLGAFTTGVLAPDGTNTAYGLSADATNGAHSIQSNSTVAFDGAGYRYDGVTAKAGLSNRIRFRNTLSGANVMFSLEGKGGIFQPNGTQLKGYGFIPHGDGFFTCYIVNNNTLENSAIKIEILRDLDTDTWIGDGVTPEVYLWKPLHSDTMNAQWIDNKGTIPDNFNRSSKTNLWEYPETGEPYEPLRFLEIAKTDGTTATGTGTTSDPIISIQDAKTIQGVPVSGDVPSTIVGLSLVGVEYENIALNTEDLTQWVPFRCTIDGTDGLVTDTFNGVHVVSKGAYTAGGVTTLEVEAKAEDKNWGYISFEGVINQAFLDLENGAFGNTSVAITATKVIEVDADWKRFLIQFASVGTSDIVLSPALSDGVQGFAGDAATVDIRFRKVMMRNGTIAQNYPYVESTGTTGKGEALDWL